jgi:membrane protease YdiL (CAAX protease family)
VSGFVLSVLGLAWLTRRGPARTALATRDGTRRALSYALVYGLCSACFWRLVQPALLGLERSPWLLALGDVIFVTLTLFVWVMVLAEGRPWREYGFHGCAGARLVLTLALGVGAAAVFSFRPYLSLVTGAIEPTADSLVFATLFAVAGSAFPEELLFRGFLQGTLEGRVNRWARLVLPALVFAGVRGLRHLPGGDVGGGEWLVSTLGIALPLGLWWGLMRDLAGGSLWPSLISHFLLEFGSALSSASPGGPS